MPDTTLIRGNSILLNLADTPLVLPDPYNSRPYTYKTVEHRFQAMKSLYIVEELDWIKVHDHIASAPTPRAAKARGRRILIATSLWDVAAFGYMLEAHIAKFFQNKDAEDVLLAQLGDLLVEHRPDPIWGDNMDGTGQNLCGKSLTIVRDMIRKYRG